MGDSNNHDADAGKPEKGLQRFESHDGDSLQSLRGSYDRALKIHYIVWDDVEATFPDIDHLLVPYTPLRLVVDADAIYSVERKNVGGEEVMDPNRDLMYSRDSAPPLVLSAKDEALQATLSSISGDNSLYSLLVKIRLAWKTYANTVSVMDDFEDDRYRSMALYINNVRRHSKLQESISTLMAAAGDVKSVQIEMDKVQENLSKLQKFLAAQEMTSRIADAHHETGALDYPTPSMFLLLPTDVDSWDPTDPQTHTFRFHFLCEHGESDSYHLHRHGGHTINRTDDFLKQFALVALTLLQMFKLTIDVGDDMSDLESLVDMDANSEDDKDSDEVKDRNDARLVRLETLAEGSQFSGTELEDLVDMAIASLRQTVVLQTKMVPERTQKLRSFLANDGATNVIEGLYPIIKNDGMMWQCRRHFLITYPETDLAILSDHVRSLGGSYSMEHGAAEIQVRSIKEVREFYNTLKVTKCIVDLSISLLWPATETEVREILSRTMDVQVHHLQLDGDGLRDHRMYTTEQGCVHVSNIVTSDNCFLRLIAFVNVTEPLGGSVSKETVTFIAGRRIVATSLPRMSSVEWNGFKQFALTFHKVVGSKYEGQDEPSDEEEEEYGDHNTEAFTTLQELTAVHCYIKTVEYLTEKYQAAKFDMADGVFHGLTEVRYPVKCSEQFLYSGTLRRFVLEVSADPEYLMILGKVLDCNPDLVEVMVQTKEKDLLSQIVFCCRHFQGRVHPVQITFFDECTGHQERVVTKLALSSKIQHAGQNSGDDLDRREFSLSAMNIKILECVVDQVSEVMTDDEAAILDLISAQFPDTLANLILNIEHLTKAGIESVQHVLSRSRIRFLRIECSAFDQELRPTLLLALARIQRSFLSSLVIHGQAVDAWLQLLAEAATLTASAGALKEALAPQLFQFEVINTATDRQLLSDRVRETFFSIMQSCPLIEVKLVNVDLLVGQQWDTILAELGMVHLEHAQGIVMSVR
ncbi:hypothetical protein BGZ74_009704 [Mortierella antarctica]|nr:hypothetical protein BGZ74_009704 [Mortierella antarctica]